MNTATHVDRPPAEPVRRRADALELLSHGHEEARALADECRRVARCAKPGRDIRPLVETLCAAMHRLAELEEQLFYPAAREALEGSCAVDLAELEHATARQIVRLMQASDPCEARYEALVVALADCVERHARHEQAELFPRVRASCMDLAELGERLSRRREELEAAH